MADVRTRSYKIYGFALTFLFRNTNTDGECKGNDGDNDGIEEDVLGQGQLTRKDGP